MPFGLMTREGSGNHVLDGVQINLWEGAILGKGALIVKYRDSLHYATSCAIKKRLNRTFGMLSRVDPRNDVLDGGRDPHAKGQFLGERTCPDMHDDTLPSTGQKRLKRS